MSATAEGAPLVVAPSPRIEVTIPLRTTANRSFGNHWAIEAARTKREYETVTLHLRARSTRCPIPPPVLVTLERLSFGRMDEDGAIISLKHVRDAAACFVVGLDIFDERNAKKIGHADRDESIVRFRYGQGKCARGQAFVRITIEPRAT